MTDKETVYNTSYNRINLMIKNHLNAERGLKTNIKPKLLHYYGDLPIDEVQRIANALKVKIVMRNRE